jgi:response regulator RpfG family c-di-GMP phosphodiesterase
MPEAGYRTESRPGVADVNLPDVYGIEVCRRIKSLPAGASIIVLQISASATAAPHAKAALASGADAYDEPGRLSVARTTAEVNSRVSLLCRRRSLRMGTHSSDSQVSGLCATSRSKRRMDI